MRYTNIVTINATEERCCATEERCCATEESFCATEERFCATEEKFIFVYRLALDANPDRGML